MRLSRARSLQLDPNFQQALRTATEAYRATLEPGNLHMALSIRDDPECKPKERIRAGEFLRGPRPVAAPAAGTVVNVNQVAGYVVNLGTPMRDLREQAATKTIDAAPREGNAADVAADVAQERGSPSLAAAFPA